MVREDRAPVRRWRRNASSGDLEGRWTTITHPFHPFRGQSFQILKAKEVAGVSSLALGSASGPTFIIPREWTDQADPSSPENPSCRLEAQSLRKLAELVNRIKDAFKKGIDR